VLVIAVRAVLVFVVAVVVNVPVIAIPENLIGA
jgi:hypothetical protein